MIDGIAGGDRRRGRALRWLCALVPAVPLVVELGIDQGGTGFTIALQILFTIAAACHLLLVFELVAKLRAHAAGLPIANLVAAALRVVISYLLFWAAFGIALDLHRSPASDGLPDIFLFYAIAMLLLLVAACGGAWLLGRLARTRRAATTDRMPR